MVDGMAQPGWDRDQFIVGLILLLVTAGCRTQSTAVPFTPGDFLLRDLYPDSPTYHQERSLSEAAPLTGHLQGVDRFNGHPSSLMSY